MTTVVITKTTTTEAGKKYKKGETHQLRTREAQDLLNAGLAVVAPYKGH